MSSSSTLIHLFAEAAEVCADEEVAVQGRDLADKPLFDDAAHAAYAGNIAPVLNDGVNAAGLLCGRDQFTSFFKAHRHWLFRQHMAPRPKTGLDDLRARRRHDNVEQHVRFGRLDHSIKRTTADGGRQTESPCQVLCAVYIKINQADDRNRSFKTRCRLDGLQPSVSHEAAANQYDTVHILSSCQDCVLRVQPSRTRMYCWLSYSRFLLFQSEPGLSGSSLRQ